MIDKRLFSLVKSSVKYIIVTVLFKWIALLSNIGFMVSLCYLVVYFKHVYSILLLMLMCIVIRYVCKHQEVLSSYKATLGVKETLREKIYQKVVKLGLRYQDKISTSEVVQLAVEGVDQLEIYFGKYLPQLFYSVLAPLTLFIFFMFINIKTAIILLIFVPLIPISIVVVQKIAKRLLSKYWNAYSELGDSFLENLQGLTTLKVYQADDIKTVQMDQEAENFRKVTMRVLIMQLNSISVMDIVAYGGSATGIIVALLEFNLGHIDLYFVLLIILLSSEFFIPMRLLGSYFHIAMNGMAASDKIFKLLDIVEPVDKKQTIHDQSIDIEISDLSFSYDHQDVLQHLDVRIPNRQFVSFVGKSGCGKSTLAGLLSGYLEGYRGSIKFNGIELSELSKDSIIDNVTLVDYDGYLFSGDVRYNLEMSRVHDDKQLWEALKKVNLDEFIKANGGLSMEIKPQGSNLSGGQKQRLLLARALLKDSPVYIFDEITSNIDIESENDIMKVINDLSKEKTVIMITHRLDNLQHVDNIYMLENHQIIESGTHKQLLDLKGEFYQLYLSQSQLLSIYKEASYE